MHRAIDTAKTMTKPLLHILALVPIAAACTSTVEGNGPALEQPSGAAAPPPRPSDSVESPEQMFEPPTFGKATPNDVVGLWTLQGSTDKTRMLIRADAIMLARRCETDSSAEPLLVTATAAARVDSGAIAILDGTEDVQTAPDGTSCKIVLVAGEAQHCNGYQSTNCFHLPGTGTQLVFLGTTSGSMGTLYGTWVKVMD